MVASESVITCISRWRSKKKTQKAHFVKKNPCFSLTMRGRESQASIHRTNGFNCSSSIMIPFMLLKSLSVSLFKIRLGLNWRCVGRWSRQHWVGQKVKPVWCELDPVPCYLRKIIALSRSARRLLFSDLQLSKRRHRHILITERIKKNEDRYFGESCNFFLSAEWWMYRCTLGTSLGSFYDKKKNATISARETNWTQKSMSTTTQTYWQSSGEIWEGQRNYSLKNEVHKDAISCFSIRKDWRFAVRAKSFALHWRSRGFFRGHVRSCEKGLWSNISGEEHFQTSSCGFNLSDRGGSGGAAG